ncbi:MAG: YfiR/HmsC family protein [Bacteroidota bacterium]|nr:YfiR/HmsC family protein [Bacteroidota bacterium]
MPLRIETQAEIFRRVFLFNKSFEGKKKLKLAVVYSSISSDIKDSLVAAFEAQGIATTAVLESALEKSIADVQVVYISPGVLNVEKICAQHRILSITGIPMLARTGKASIALGIRNGKANIIVHRQQLKNEAQEISAELLQIAQVIQ